MTRSILMTLFLFLSNSIFGQWIQTNGPTGGWVWKIHSSGDDLYVSTGDGIYKSTDDGESWTGLNQDFHEYTNAIHKFKDRLFVGTSDGIYASDDEGINWKFASDDLPKSWAYDIHSHNDVLFTSSSKGAFRSVDGGETWLQMTAGLPNEEFPISYSSSENIVYAEATDDYFYRSVNEGESWIKLNKLPTTSFVRAWMYFDSLLYAITPLDEFFISANGNIWELISAGLPSHTHFSDFTVDSSGIYLTTRNGIFHSADKGENWEKISEAINGNIQIHDVTFHNNFLFVTSLSGLYKSADDGYNWEEKEEGLITGQLNGILQNGDQLISWADYNGFHQSFDNGNNWEILHNDSLFERYISDLKLIDGVLYAGIYNFPESGLFKSEDNGMTWERMDNFPDYSAITIEKIGSKLFVSGISGIYFSEDNGQTWEHTDEGLVFVQNGDTLQTSVHTIAETSEGLISSSHSAVYISYDDGYTWETTEDFDGILDFAEQEGVWYGLTYAGDFGEHSVVRSTNGGKSWHFIFHKNSDHHATCISEINEQVYIGTNKGIYKISEDNSGMVHITEGISNSADITSIMIQQDSFVVGTIGNGVWKRAVNDPLNNVKTPKNDLKVSVYPIPFKDSFWIDIENVTDGESEFCLYNSIGQLVKCQTVIQDGNLIEMDAKGLKSGVYILNVEVEGSIYSHKLIKG